MKTLIYFTNLVSICMNTWINTLFYIRLFLVCVISSLIWISSLILCTTSLYALAGPKIGQIKSCILYYCIYFFAVDARETTPPGLCHLQKIRILLKMIQGREPHQA